MLEQVLTCSIGATSLDHKPRPPNQAPTRFSKLVNPLLTTRWQDFTNWGVVLVGLLIDRGATALALILVARDVHPLEYGQYISCFVLATFLVVIPGFGMDAWLLTQSRTDSKKVTSLWGNAFRLRVGLLVIWFLSMGLLSIFLPQDTYPKDILFLTTLGAAFDSLTLLSYSSLRATSRHWIITALQSLASLTLLGIVLLLPPDIDKVYVFALIRLILSVVVAGIAMIIVGIKNILSPLVNKSLKSILKASNPFLWSEFASSIYDKADINIISIVLGSAGTGIYGPALNLLQVTFLAPRSYFFLTVPKLSAAFIETRQAYLQQSKHQFFVQITLGLLLSVFLFIFSPMLIQLTFGQAYQQSSEILRLFSPIPFLRSINFALAAILSSSKLQAQRIKPQILSAVFNVLANLIVILPYGIRGIAFVYVLSELILAIGYTFTTFKNLKINR